MLIHSAISKDVVTATAGYIKLVLGLSFFGFWCRHEQEVGTYARRC